MTPSTRFIFTIHARDPLVHTHITAHVERSTLDAAVVAAHVRARRYRDAGYDVSINPKATVVTSCARENTVNCIDYARELLAAYLALNTTR